MDYVTLILGASFGIILLILVVLVLCYVLLSLSHMKALQALGYKNAWLAWIPFGVWFACADAVCDDGTGKTTLFGSLEIPAIILKIWWIVPLVLFILPINTSLYNVISIAFNVIFMGCTYAKMYARLDGKTEREEQVLGCVSGWLKIVAVVKFFTIK